MVAERLIIECVLVYESYSHSTYTYCLCNWVSKRVDGIAKSTRINHSSWRAILTENMNKTRTVEKVLRHSLIHEKQSRIYAVFTMINFTP